MWEVIFVYRRVNNFVDKFFLWVIIVGICSVVVFVGDYGVIVFVGLL